MTLCGSNCRVIMGSLTSFQLQSRPPSLDYRPTDKHLAQVFQLWLSCAMEVTSTTMFITHLAIYLTRIIRMPIGRLLRGPAGVDPTFITFVNAYMYVCIRSLSVGLLSLMFVCAVGLMCVHGPMVACINIGRYVCMHSCMTVYRPSTMLSLTVTLLSAVCYLIETVIVLLWSVSSCLAFVAWT